MEEEQIVINFERPIPVFPLDGAVLLPQGALPLHVFEQRYRQMVQDAIDSNGLIAMAMFDREPDEQEYAHGRPDLRPNVCVGYIQQYERIEDGRYLILLRGLCRARILREEEEHGPYRTLMLEPTETELPDDEAMDPQRGRLEDLLASPALDRVKPVRELRQLIDGEVPTAALIDASLAQLARDPEHRYELLCETDARQRGRQLLDDLEQLCATAEAGEDTGLDEDDGFDDEPPGFDETDSDGFDPPSV